MVGRDKVIKLLRKYPKLAVRPHVISKLTNIRVGYIKNIINKNMYGK